MCSGLWPNPSVVGRRSSGPRGSPLKTLDWQFDKRCTHLARKQDFSTVASCTFRPSGKLKCRFGFECCCCQPTGMQLTCKGSGQRGVRSVRKNSFGRVDLASLYSSCGPMSQLQSGPHFRCLTQPSLPFSPFARTPSLFSNLCPQSVGQQMPFGRQETPDQETPEKDKQMFSLKIQLLCSPGIINIIKWIKTL